MGYIHWSSIFIFLVLGLLGLWVAFSFLNKNGLILFSIIAVALTYILGGAQFGESNIVPFGAILMPLVYFSLIVMYEKYSKEDAQKMFFCLLATFGVFFLCAFLMYAYYESAYGNGYFLNWGSIGTSLCQIISFALVGYLANVFVDKVPINKEYKYLRRAIIVSIAGAIDACLVVFLGYIGYVPFGNMLVSFLLYLIFVVGTSFAVAFLRKYLNRQPSPIKEDKKEETKEETKEEPEVVEVEVKEEDIANNDQSNDEE